MFATLPHYLYLSSLKHYLGYRSSKRKFSDTDIDHDGASNWSASSGSQSRAFSNDTFNTPLSGSSFKIAATVPIAQPTPDSDFISFRPHQLITSGESSAEIRTPKRRKYHGSSRSSHARDQRQLAASLKGDKQVQIREDGSVTPIPTPLQESAAPQLKPVPKYALNTRRSPPQTRSRTRMSRSGRPSLNEQNTTAAAVAAALTGNTGASNHDLSS